MTPGSHGDGRVVMAPCSVWRCTACGRWSFAARRPLRHWRTVVVGEADYGQVIEIQYCGPFLRFDATPTTDVGPLLPEHGRLVPGETWPVLEDDPSRDIF